MFGDSHEDRTIPATPRRLAEARRQGYAPRSRELTAAIVALTSAVALWFAMPTMWHAAQELFRATWLHPVVRPGDVVTESVPAIAQLTLSVGGVLIAAVVAAIVVGLLQSGFRPGWRWPQPRWSHVSLFSGWQRLRSGGGWAAILFVLKSAAVCALLALLIPALLGYGAVPDLKGIAGLATQILAYGVWFTVALLMLALPDVWARRDGRFVAACG
ncbi:MAG: EscU/YscU/HrcU family type III secretion system export apparatus switch protein [Planctomycetaceae bacterium]